MFPYSLTLRAHAEAVRPCFLRKRPHGKDGCESHCWIGSIVPVFRMERMTGFGPAVSCLGSRRAAAAPHPHGRGSRTVPDRIPSDRRSACFPTPGNQGLVARGEIRTHDLQVMSLAGYRTALPRMAALSRGRRTARGVFRTARKGPFPGGGEKGPAYAGRPSPPSTPWRNRTSVDGFGDRRTATVLMAYCVFRSSIVKRPRRLPGFVPVRRHATVCVPVAEAAPMRRVASHTRTRRRPARRRGTCLWAGTPRTAMRPPTPPTRPALRAPATGRRRPCPEARTPRTAAPPRTPSSLRKP